MVYLRFSEGPATPKQTKEKESTCVMKVQPGIRCETVLSRLGVCISLDYSGSYVGSHAPWLEHGSCPLPAIHRPGRARTSVPKRP